MPYQTGIPAALVRFGVTVETVPGWETRGPSSFSPRGVVCHWTAGPRGAVTRPSLRVVTEGHGSLPGPLCQVYLARDGVAVVVAAGRANHAGAGGARGLTGNSSVYGIEAESAGDGDWTAAQRQAYPRVVAALLSLADRDHTWSFGHSEWAPTRKIDIRDWTMADMRDQVASVLSGGQAGNGGGAVVAVPTPRPTGKPVLRRGTRSAHVGVVQRFLGITDDSVFGLKTLAAVVAYQGSVGLVDDGIVGAATWAKFDAGVRAAPMPPRLASDGQLWVAEDGYLGPATIARWQQIMGTPIDGVISRPSALIVAVQARVGATQDGYIGPRTIAAIQQHLGTPADGVISSPSAMVKALQKRLNASSF
jgi:peptidoglycan hydrolase-like protein with peptidoglycan-binding domain